MFVVFILTANFTCNVLISVFVCSIWLEAVITGVCHFIFHFGLFISFGNVVVIDLLFCAKNPISKFWCDCVRIIMQIWKKFFGFTIYQIFKACNGWFFLFCYLFLSREFHNICVNFCQFDKNMHWLRLYGKMA